MCYWSEGVGPWAAVGGALMLLFTAGVILLGVWFFSRSARHSHGGEGNGALAVARERYAKGEIGKEEFERIKKDLS